MGGADHGQRKAERHADDQRAQRDEQGVEQAARQIGPAVVFNEIAVKRIRKIPPLGGKIIQKTLPLGSKIIQKGNSPFF